jgi:hypothetical protein
MTVTDTNAYTMAYTYDANNRLTQDVKTAGSPEKAIREADKNWGPEVWQNGVWHDRQLFQGPWGDRVI